MSRLPTPSRHPRPLGPQDPQEISPVRLSGTEATPAILVGCYWRQAFRLLGGDHCRYFAAWALGKAGHFSAAALAQV